MALAFDRPCLSLRRGPKAGVVGLQDWLARTAAGAAIFFIAAVIVLL